MQWLSYNVAPPVGPESRLFHLDETNLKGQYQKISYQRIFNHKVRSGRLINQIKRYFQLQLQFHREIRDFLKTPCCICSSELGTAANRLADFSWYTSRIYHSHVAKFISIKCEHSYRY
jgi:hypothetical protein